MSAKHCPGCVCGRRAPVQGDTHNPTGSHAPKPAGTIDWAEHEEAWAAYAAKYGRDQSAERIAHRGGFGWYELCELLGREPKTWAVYGAVAERERL